MGAEWRIKHSLILEISTTKKTTCKATGVTYKVCTVVLVKKSLPYYLGL